MAVDTAVLEKQVQYKGEGISVQSLEETINSTRERQNAKVSELEQLRKRNTELTEALADEVKKLRKFSDYLKTGKLKGGFWANVKEVLSYIPGLKGLALTRRSIEELLRQQYEISSLRVKEAAEFADKLQAAQADLFQEIERLGQKVIEAAENEEIAADYVLKIQEVKQNIEKELEELKPGSAEARKKQAELDKAQRLLAEHSMQLKLYHSAEERIARLKENTKLLAETIGALYQDITQYTTAASEKLDLVAGQIQALGTAADASTVMLEMKKALDVLNEAMNDTAQFVSETQIYFRRNLDHLMDELNLYDEQTSDMLKRHLEESQSIEEKRIAEALAVAKARKEGKQGEAAQPGQQ